MLSPQNKPNYLEIFDALPDLLQLAREQCPENLYPFQDELREQYRADGIAFRWSMPMRHYGICRKCDQKFTHILYQLENPQQDTSAATTSTHLHAVREHGDELDGQVKLFLESLDRSC